MSSAAEIFQDISLFTLHQWLELAAIVVIPMVVMYLIGKFAWSIEDRRHQKYSSEIDKRLEEIRRMPD